MKFIVYKVSDNGEEDHYEEEVELNTIEDLEKLATEHPEARELVVQFKRYKAPDEYENLIWLVDERW